MRTARLAVTADALGVSRSCARDAAGERPRSAPSTSPSRELPADRTATSAPDAPPRRSATRRTALAHTVQPSPARAAHEAARGAPARRTTSMPPPLRERLEQQSPKTTGRRGPRVREQILVRPAARGRTGPQPWHARGCPYTLYSVSPARRGAILQRTENRCNTNATGTITYPIAIREASRTRCKSPLFDAEWLARILFAGRGYLERGR